VCGVRGAEPEHDGATGTDESSRDDRIAECEDRFADWGAARTALTRRVVALAASLILATALCVGCASTNPLIESVEWSGEAEVCVALDRGRVCSAVEYVGILETVESDSEIAHCPVLVLDVLVQTDLGTIDLYARGVPPDHESAPVDPICYERIGPLGFSTRPGGSAGQD